MIYQIFTEEAAIPGWAVATIVAIGELIIGGIVYFILKKTVLDIPVTPRYTPARTVA